MTPDAELLRRYADENSEAAFAELVQRHLGLVYFAARRQLAGDEHRGREVAQAVFTDLARKASTLQRHPALASWLHTSTRFAATKLRRSEGRRMKYEQEAQAAPELIHAVETGPDWARLEPLIDELVHELNEREREAVLLRFFEGHAFAEIGRMLAVSEDAARMRVERGLEKLRGVLARRGVTSTAAALGLALQGSAAAALPAGLAATVTSAALAGAAAVNVLGSFGIPGFMSSTKFAPTVAVVAALVSVGAAWFLENESRAATAALALTTRENAAASARLEALTRAARDEAQAVADLRRSMDAKRATVALPLPAPPSGQDSGIEAQEFLAAHPEARRLLDAMRESSFEVFYGAALQDVGLAPEERARIASEVVKVMPYSANVGTLRFSENQQGGEYGAAVFGGLHELLGEERFQRYIEARRWEEVHTMVKGVAATFHGSDTPLSPEQGRAVIETIKRHSNNVGDGRARRGIAIDWPVVARELEPLLSPAQIAAFSAAHASALGAQTFFKFHGAVTPVAGGTK